MESLAITIKPGQGVRDKKFLIEMDVERFGRMAANFGFFSDEFLESLDRAEEDCRAGRVRRIRSLRELRK